MRGKLKTKQTGIAAVSHRSANHQFDWVAYECDPAATGGNDIQVVFALPNQTLGMMYGHSDRLDAVDASLQLALATALDGETPDPNEGIE